MTTYTVYRATNLVNGKAYVGFTNNFKRRQTNHKNLSKNTRFPFAKAIMKYGWTSFSWDILFESENREDAIQKEIESIASLKTQTPLGYNLTPGGEGRNELPEEEREAIRQRMRDNNPMKKLRHNGGTFKKGHVNVFTPERNEKIRQAKLLNNPMKGNPLAASHLNSTLFKCSHCDVETTKGNWTRWHETNCKTTRY